MTNCSFYLVENTIDLNAWFLLVKVLGVAIKLLESPIPAAAAAAAAPPSQKAHCDNISGTKRGTIDPLVSKRPEKNSE